MARSLTFSILLILVIALAANAHKLGSQMYKSGIPIAMKELLGPVLNSYGHCGKNVIYHDLSFPLVYKRADKEGGMALQILKSNLSFFLQKDLFFGNPLELMIDSTGVLPECAYLPRGMADSIPFSSAKIGEILSQFSIDPKSAEATSVKETLEFCDSPALNGEGKTCTTSLQAMEELAVAKLGKGARPLTTKIEADSTEKRTYEVKRLELLGKNYMSCHRQSYPYAVHYCHKMPATVVYQMSLLREDGVDGEALAICHRDTSDWDAKFFAFERFKVQPGTEAICQLYTQGHLLWVAGGNKESGIEQVI